MNANPQGFYMSPLLVLAMENHMTIAEVMDRLDGLGRRWPNPTKTQGRKHVLKNGDRKFRTE
jgi:hypothetical protein